MSRLVLLLDFRSLGLLFCCFLFTAGSPQYSSALTNGYNHITSSSGAEPYSTVISNVPPITSQGVYPYHYCQPNGYNWYPAVSSTTQVAYPYHYYQPNWYTWYPEVSSSSSVKSYNLITTIETWDPEPVITKTIPVVEKKIVHTPTIEEPVVTKTVEKTIVHAPTIEKPVISKTIPVIEKTIVHTPIIEKPVVPKSIPRIEKTTTTTTVHTSTIEEPVIQPTRIEKPVVHVTRIEEPVVHITKMEEPERRPKPVISAVNIEKPVVIRKDTTIEKIEIVPTTSINNEPSIKESVVYAKNNPIIKETIIEEPVVIMKNNPIKPTVKEPVIYQKNVTIEKTIEPVVPTYPADIRIPTFDDEDGFWVLGRKEDGTPGLVARRTHKNDDGSTVIEEAEVVDDEGKESGESWGDDGGNVEIEVVTEQEETVAPTGEVTMGLRRKKIRKRILVPKN